MNYIGLFNKECENPAYYCRCHNVFLSAEDAEFKQCLHKPTKDLVGITRCPYISTLDEYNKEEARRNEVSTNYKAQNKRTVARTVANSKSAYRQTVERLLREQNNG
jgi:hypothetical protein